MTLSERCEGISTLFDSMHGFNASSYQISLVNYFREQHPELNDDLDFCFEVLAGKHKLGYKIDYQPKTTGKDYREISIKDFYNHLRQYSTTQRDVEVATTICWATGFGEFWYNLINREYRLGYTNRKAMVTDKHCMLAKTYPKDYRREQYYYVQEKLNGNRCIAYYLEAGMMGPNGLTTEGKWYFMSRSQKPLKVDFDMTGFDITRIYDGEVMTKNKMGNRDFAATSGKINSKFGSKDDLIYFIYDILDDEMPYKERRLELKQYRGKTSHNVEILKVLDKVWVYPNPDYNRRLDYWLDKIVARGGEGIMLRDPDAVYYHSKHSGDRKDCLMKYKKTKTCDLRIVGWNEGKGKYQGMIGSFICETDDRTVRVNVAGMDDSIRAMDPEDAIGRIIEVAYFEGSKAKNKTTASLQFPRMKGWRDDKTETSMY